MISQTASKQKNFRRADGSPRRVLYAEDQTTSRIVTTAMLQRMGFEVDAVADGEHAVALARADDYDVIMLDIEMPVMDGVTAARSIRSELTHCNSTPILALSAFLADSTEHTKWRDAFDSAVPKPANTNELLTAMTKAMKLKDAKISKAELVTAESLSLKPTPDDIVDALRKSLSKGAWNRLVKTAAAEMRHIVFSMAACIEADDSEALRKCGHGLKGLALNFGAARIVELSIAVGRHGEKAKLQELLGELSVWEASA